MKKSSENFSSVPGFFSVVEALKTVKNHYIFEFLKKGTQKFFRLQRAFFKVLIRFYESPRS